MTEEALTSFTVSDTYPASTIHWICSRPISWRIILYSVYYMRMDAAY